MEETKKKNVEIAKWMNRSRFMLIEEALDTGKIRLFLGEYQRGQGMGANAHHFMDIDDARVVFDDLANGWSLEYKEYKGSINGQIVSRILTVKRVEQTYWIEATNGPGRKSETGAVMPAGQPTAQVAVGLPLHDARRLGHAVLAYLRAWDARNLLRHRAVVSGIEIVRLKRPTQDAGLDLLTAG